MIGLADALESLREGRQDSTPDYQRLVDPVTGLIRWVHRQPVPDGLPLGIHSFTARGSDMSRVGPWPADPTGGGDGLDPDACWRAAIGEYLERYCGNHVPDDLVMASHRDLTERGIPALDPGELALYSDRQYATPGFPFVRFDRELEVRWAQGMSLTTGEPVFLPASLVWVNFRYGRYRAEPPTHFHMFSGLAAGDTLPAALRSAVSELVERDATMMWWLGDYPAARVEPADDPLLAGLLTPGRGDIGWHLVAIPSDFDLPVAGALLVDHRDGIAGMGFACRDNFRDAAVKAAAEAVQLHRLAWGIKDPAGKVWQAIRQGVVHGNTLKPYRADSCYLDTFRSDYRDLTDLAHHSQIYLDRRLWPELSRVTEVPRRAIAELPTLPQNTLAAYVDRLSRHGVDLYAVDLTTPDVRRAGLWVVRVIAPRLIPNGPAGFPFIGSERLYESPVRNGWRSRRASEETLNYVPLPHS